MRLEEAHDGRHEVPGEVDDCQETNGADRHAVGEQHFDVLYQSGLLACRFLRLKRSALLQLPLQVPSDEGYYEQGEEHDTRTEHMHGFYRSLRTVEPACQTLYPTEQYAVCFARMTRREEHTQQQYTHRTDTPGHLRDRDIAPAAVDFRTLGDVRPRSRHTHAHGDTRKQESRQQHREIDRAHHHQHAEHIDEQVVCENELTPVLVCQKTADDSTDGGTETVGADEIEPT